MSLFVDIKKTFPDFELSAQLECGPEVLSLLGASGCGKSLMLKCIAGIEKPDKGIIKINEETVFNSEKRINLPPQGRGVGYLFQSYALFPNMTLYNNIACVIRKPKDERKQIVDDIIKSFQLETVKDLRPRQVSGGQQQRAALARILVSNPNILMLDEPFSALDSHLKWTLEQEIISVLSYFKGTTVFVSHDRNEAYRISDKIAIMDKGKIELIGGKEKIFDSPKTLTAARITGCKNISSAQRLGKNIVKALDWGIELQTEQPVPDSVKHIGIRAHNFEMVKSKENENDFSCRIHQIINEPFERVVLFAFGDTANKEARLSLKMPKHKWNYDETDEFVLRIPKDKIMYLE